MYPDATPLPHRPKWQAQRFLLLSLSGRAVQGKVNTALSFCYKSNKCPLDLHSPAEALSLKVTSHLAGL
jgi:hypothetical protein